MCPAAEIQFVAHPWPESEGKKKRVSRVNCKCEKSANVQLAKDPEARTKQPAGGTSKDPNQSESM